MAEPSIPDTLASCRTVDELRATMRALVRELGYMRSIYCVEVDAIGATPFRFCLTDTAEDAGCACAIDDAAFRRVRERQVVPVVWRGEGRDAGITVFVHGARGEASMFSVTGPLAPIDPATVLGAVQLLGCYLHDAVKRIVLAERLPRPVALTPRERECLAWAAEGKTAGEIGGILLVAERTVNFHIGNAVRKLGASSRQHAVARAVSMGLVAM